MSKPKAPAAPDPMQVASAQTNQSVGTAVANTAMGQVNQHGPDGNLDYSQTGSYLWTDPNSGNQSWLPQYTATTTLSPQAQALRDANNRGNLTLANLGADQAQRAGDLLSRPMDMSTLPARADRSQLKPSEYGGDLNGPQFEDIGNLPQYEQVGEGPSYGRVGQGGGYSDVGAGPSYARQSGSADLQSGYDVGDSTRYEAALMERLNPQLDRQRQLLETNLANRGVREGVGRDRALDENNRVANDARIAAILNAGQEQSRVTGLNRDAASFKNSARQQTFDNANNQIGYNNQLAGLERADQVNTAQFNNQNRSRSIADTLAATGFNNNAGAAERSDQLQRIGLNNQTASQDLANRTNAAGFNNSNRSQTYANQQATQARNDQNANNRYSQISNLLQGQDQQRASQLQEQLAMRNQPLNEIAALLSGSQVNTPNFNIATPDRMATTDIAGIQQQGFQNQQQTYAQKMAQYNALIGGLSGMGAAKLYAG